MNVDIAESALRDLKKIRDKAVKEKILTTLERFEQDPGQTPIRKLEGYQDLWRIPVDDWRVVLLILWKEDHATVVCVANRKHVYQKLRRRK